MEVLILELNYEKEAEAQSEIEEFEY